MIILSHRGYWKESQEKNTEVAFQRSFMLGFGTETDVRDQEGQLVISHDVPRGNSMPFETFLSLLGANHLPLAINIKADGLADLIRDAMRRYNREQWFVFDMSTPDTRAQLRAGNPVFARMSEVERDPAWLDAATGVWLDAFEGRWYDHNLISVLLEKRKHICVVSPELHGRSHEETWDFLLPFSGKPGLMLCTDLPELAREYFARRRK